MSSIETRTASPVKARASGPPPTRAPGIPPGREFRTIRPSELAKIPSSPRAELSKTVKLHSSLKIENNLKPKLENKPTTKTKTENPVNNFQRVEAAKVNELPKTRSTFETIKPIKIEAKTQEIKPAEPKGSERLAQLGNTQEYKISGNIDPFDKQVSKAEVKNMQTVVQSAKPENRIDVKEIKPATPIKNELPKGRERFQKNSELIARLNKQKEIKTAAIPQISPEKMAIQIKPAEVIKQISAELKTNNIQQQKQEAVKAIVKNPEKLTEVYEKSIPEKALPEIVAKGPNQTRRELFKNLIKDQQFTLGEVLETKLKKELQKSPGSELKKIVPIETKAPIEIGKLTEKVNAIKPELNPSTEIRNPVSIKTLEQNLAVVKQVLAEKKPENELKSQEYQTLSPQILTELIKSPNVIDFQKAKELIETKKQNVIESDEPQKIESPTQAVKVLEQVKQQNEQKSEKPKEKTINTPQVEATIKLFENPENINIQSEKRAEAILLLQEVADTKEYASSPKLQEQIKILVKKEQERVVEESAMTKTAEAMINADIDQEVVAERLQAVAEVKHLAITPEQLEIMIKKAETKALEYQKLIAENGELIEEEEDEYQLMMNKLQLLLIELDEKTLEKRFESIFKALEKTWIQAQEQGWEKVNGYQLIANIEHPEPKELESLLVRPLGQTDGTLVETTKDIEKMGNFDNLDQARQALSNILLNHLPGKASNQPNAQQLSDQQVREIFQGGSYPVQMGNGVKNNISYLPNYSNVIAA